MQLINLNCGKRRVIFVLGLSCEGFRSRGYSLGESAPCVCRGGCGRCSVGGREWTLQKMKGLKNKGHQTKVSNQKQKQSPWPHLPPQVPIHVSGVKGQREELWGHPEGAASPPL